MASQNKINLIKIKNHLQNKNFKIGGFLNFKSDASEKIFKLCKTANQSLLVLSFLNKPSDYQKYIKATDILISQNVEHYIRLDAYSHVQKLDLSWYENENIG